MKMAHLPLQGQIWTAATGSHVEWDGGCKPEIRTQSLNSAARPPTPHQNHCHPLLPASLQKFNIHGDNCNSSSCETCCQWTPFNAPACMQQLSAAPAASILPPTHTEGHTNGGMTMWCGRGGDADITGGGVGGGEVQVIPVERKKQINKGRKIQQHCPRATAAWSWFNLNSGSENNLWNRSKEKIT